MIKTDICLPIGYCGEDIKKAIAARIPVSHTELKNVAIIKRTLDVKVKSDIHYKMTVAVELTPEREAGLLKMRKLVFPCESFSYTPPKSRLTYRPVVVGSGPCGLFAALTLAEAGARPIVLERGLPVEERRKKVEDFYRSSVLDTECNVQFGEGGAGTYSDGKLKSGAPDKYKVKVLSEFVAAGANEEIMYSSTAHLGTDKLSDIVKNIREKIKSLGGEFIFSARLSDVKTKSGAVTAAVYEKDGAACELPTDNILLATGHSARDVFSLLDRLAVPMEPKGFGIGMRVEHPREYIDRLVYGDNAPDGIETASYHLVTHLKNGRSVYSFCMCPGGSVVAASSEKEGIVTNGMSEYKRNADNSNSALLVSVSKEDFGSESVFAGIELQKKIERAAYSLTSSYKAPSVTMAELVGNGKGSGSCGVAPSYPLGTEHISPEKYLPDFVTMSLRAAISDFDEWMRGFCFGDAVLTGPETRTTSPIRVMRNPETREAFGIAGLYPAGEGAGYAGGIVSSATDGIRTAEAMLLNKE